MSAPAWSENVRSSLSATAIANRIEGAVLLDGPVMAWVLGGGAIIVLFALFLVLRQGARSIGRPNDVVRGGAESSGWEGYFANVPEAVPLRGVFTFSYEDVEGSYSHRTVDVLMIIPRADRTTLFGLCHERHEYRHFNLARVTKMVDVESGQVIEDPRLELMGRCRAARGRPGRDGDRP